MNISRHTQPIWLVLILSITTAIYWSGLSGRFLLDDFPHIVLNKNILHLDSLDDFMLIVSSGHAGPGGRPIALLTFAIQAITTGIEPYFFKLVNLIIHVVNAVLVYCLAYYFLKYHSARSTVSINPKWLLAFPLVCCAWWAFNPVAITGVLYIVQRMTSLSATFTLLGLIVYIIFRFRAADTGSGNFPAILVLFLSTALAYYTKENGILTPAYAYLIETFILKWRAFPGYDRLGNHILSRIVLAVAVLAAALYLYTHPFLQGYVNRPFTFTERVLTQTQVLWFYISQIILPNSTSLSLYHDDFPISQGFATPLSTSFAILGHMVVAICAYLLRHKMPLLAFGTLWFYLGHSLESSIFPLEMVYEHRNYLPMLGLILALASLPIYLQSTFQKYGALYIIYAVLILGCAVVTAGRAAVWGQVDYAILEAERKPLSARANFDAGLTIMDIIESRPELAMQYAEDARRYYLQGIKATNSSATPASMASYTGLFALQVLLKEKVPETLIVELEEKLRHGPIHPVVTMNLLKIHELQYPLNPYFTTEYGERIYRAILDNPRSRGDVTANAMIAYGLLWGTRGEPEQKLQMFERAIKIAPHLHEARIIYISELIELKQYAKAAEQLNILITKDTKNRFKKNAAYFKEILARIDQNSP